MDATALAVQLFVVCVNGYNVLSNARALGADSNLLQCKFQIEELRLIHWGQYWGFREDDTTQLEQSLLMRGQRTRRVVEETLTAISGILCNSDALMRRYGLRQNDLRSGVGRDLETVGVAGNQELQERLEFEMENSRTFVAQLNCRNSLYQKCMWGVRDKDKLERLIVELKGFNDSLIHLLPMADERSLDWSTATAVMARSSDPEKLNLVGQALVQLGQQEASLMVKFRRSNITLEREATSASTVFCPTLSLVVNVSNIQFAERGAIRERALAKYNDRPVLIEWKTYPPPTGTIHNNTRARRAENLARQLHIDTPRPEGFGVLPCLGYFDEAVNFRYGFVNALPPEVQYFLPMSLLELLSPPLVTHIPDLGDRFRLAESLARSVLILHSSGWLHKSIRSSNVVFFHCAKLDKLLMRHPYIVGFDYSRPDHFDELSTDRSTGNGENALYRHPDLQGSSPRRYTAADDIFSLGLVLLEIGLWKRIQALDGAGGGDFLAQCKREAKKLTPKTGGVYKRVVERCLSGVLGASLEVDVGWEDSRGDRAWEDEWREEKIEKAGRFYWRVVHQLEKCQA